MSLVNKPNIEFQGYASQPNLISMGRAKTLIKTLVAEGTNLNALLSGTDIELRDLTQFGEAIPLRAYLKLIENACCLAPNSGFSVKMGEQFHLNHDGLLACRVMSSDNVEQAMGLLTLYQPLFTQIMHLNFSVDARYGTFTIHPSLPLDNALPFFVEYIFAAIYSLGKFCLGSEPFYMQVELSYPKPEGSDYHHKFFANPVRFDCTQNRVMISKRVLKRPLIFANKGAAEANDAICQDRVRYIKKEGDILQKVTALIRSKKLSEISVENLAEQLHMSPRTLRRQLKAHNVSYKTLLEEERKRTALQKIQQQDIPMEALAEQLGYQDASSFSRAFKRWYGVPPNLYKGRSMLSQDAK